MAKINKADVEHVAALARLELNDLETEKFTEQLSSVLEYFEKLDAVDTKGVQSIDQINEMENIVAADETGKKYDRSELLANAPEEKDGFIKVKAVFE